MSRRRPVAVLTLLMLAVSTCASLAQQPAARASRPAAAGSAAAAANAPIATVGGRPIPRVELDQRVQQVLADYAQRKGSPLPAEMRDMVRRQVLEGLIRAQLMTLEAKRLGMMASEADGEAALRQLPVFNQGGHFDAARYEGIKANQPREFTGALTSVREQLAARKLAAGMEQRLSPPDAETRAAVSRGMTRVTVDLLTLRAADFGPVGEEPRESQVVDWYRTHTHDYAREARATLTLVFVNSPALGDSLKRVPSAAAEWSQRMRLDAERIIARVRKGESLDSVAMNLGPRSNIVVAGNNFPGYWRGTASQSARVFDPAGRGEVLPEPVESNDGWLVVRVDNTTPAHVAPLREVAREIRSLLRRDARLHRDENERRALYAQVRDSLAAPGWPIRYAAVDTQAIAVPEPGPEELDAYFRAHQADYATFDSRSGGIVSKSLDEVRGDVRTRYLRDRRQVEARSAADQLLQAWRAGTRATALEARLGARVTPALVAGGRIDTGTVARVLSDTIWAIPNIQGGGILNYPRGLIVWQGLPRVERVVPTLEQAGTLLDARLQRIRASEETAGGLALFKANPRRFAKGNTIHLTRANFQPRSQLSVPLTREEVEKWHREHIDRYSAPEMVTARHILVMPEDKSPAADQRALAKTKEILRRIKAGEDFTALARTYSEDPATRDIGGDLGSFARGTMLEPIEKVAFSLPAGTLYDQPIKTILGYHVLKVTDHLPPEIKPLRLIYAAVAVDAANEKANRMAQQECDSLLRAVRDPRAFGAAGERAGATVNALELGVDEKAPTPESQVFFTAVQATSPGHFVPGSFAIKGQGAWCAVVDSITPAREPRWDEAREQAIAEYRREAGSRAQEAKRAELDSLLAGGVTLDSLAAAWGGLVRVPDVSPGRSLPSLGNSDEADSLMFGGRRAEPGLAVGAESGWVHGAGGLARLRCVSRSAPTAAQVSERSEQMRKAAVEQKLMAYFDDLKKRYPVAVLDRRLRDVSLMAPPQGAVAP